MTIDLVLKGNNVYYNGRLQKLSLLIENGKIAGIGSYSEVPSAEKVIDVGDKLVLPGGVDPHTHIEGYSRVGTIETGSRSAAIGGTTSVLDFSERKGDITSIEAALQKLGRFKKDSVVDYTVKPMMPAKDFEDLDELDSTLKKFNESGIVAFKIFTTYENLGRKTDNYQISNIMKMARKHDLIVQVHAEDNAIAEGNRKRFRSAGKIEPKYHAQMKPNLAEDIAITNVAYLAKEAGVTAYMVHTSTRDAPDIIQQYRSWGTSIYGETCPQYLILTDDKFSGPDGNEYLCSPPLRKKEDNEAMWQALSSGKIQTVGSDHVPFLREQKKPGIPFDEVPNGIPGAETRLPMVYSEGVAKGKISLETFVNVISTNPAKIFGLFPRKGTIEVGSDADLVVFDPRKKHSLSAEDLHQGSDITVYGGMTCNGWPAMTIAGGEVLVENDEIVADKHRGKYLGRNQGE